MNPVSEKLHDRDVIGSCRGETGTIEQSPSVGFGKVIYLIT